MNFALLPNLSLLTAVAGLLVIFGRHLPEAKKKIAEEVGGQNDNQIGFVAHKPDLGLQEKIWSRLGFWVKRFWHFLLEAKDIRKPASVGYRIKKILPKRKNTTIESFETTVSGKDEHYFLELIKKTPKDLELYNQLGKLYTDTKRFQDGRDIFIYLVKRDPGNAVYYSRLAYASFKLGLFQEAVSNYEKSLALDPAQPNRYYNLALSLEAMGKVAEALVPIEKALELEKDNKKYRDLQESLKRAIGIAEKDI